MATKAVVWRKSSSPAAHRPSRLYACEIEEKRRLLFPVSIVPFIDIRMWESFYTGEEIDLAEEIREYPWSPSLRPTGQRGRRSCPHVSLASAIIYNEKFPCGIDDCLSLATRYSPLGTQHYHHAPVV
jgi:hypothetical protein